jgi:hypothetical protein
MMFKDLAQDLERHWLRTVFAVWLALCVWLVWQRWAGIHWFALGDTDDNLRMVQVRDWLAGQGWYDLRQYRLNAPDGADIHWSRFVDLPIAGLMLLFRQFMSPFDADRWAAALAPLIPLVVIMIGVALTCRRLIHPLAYLPAFVALIYSAMLMSMVQPLRIDHHNWQLAMVALVMAGLADPDARRGGWTVGCASAASLTIGMEMFPYLGLAGAALALRWVWEGTASAARLKAYGLSLALGTALGFLLFASNANWVARCDALTPVWGGAMIVAGGLAALLTALPLDGRGQRLAAAALGGAVLAAGFVWFAPQCLSNLEGLSPEVKRLWFNNIREVRPVWLQAPKSKIPLLVNVAIGLVGHGVLLMQRKQDARLPAILGLAAMALAAALMLMWQGRAGPVAQLLSLPGIAALAVVLGDMLFARLGAVWALVGLTLVTVGIGGAAAQWGVRWLPANATAAKAKPGAAKAPDPARMGRRCSTIPAHAPLNRLAPAKIFTFVDLAPRLITLTRHTSITGPYHRNGNLILDVHRAFRATAKEARSIVQERHHADYVLICPGSPESTLYTRDAPHGFYAQLAAGQTPDWLEPVTLEGGTPFRIWRVLPKTVTPDKRGLDLRVKSPTSPVQHRLESTR